MSSSKIAYFGHPGSFASIAAQKFIQKRHIVNYQLFPCETFDEVLQYVLGDEVYGVIPYNNSYAGSVDEYVKLQEPYKKFVIDDISIGVHHCLLHKGTSQIKKVVSHPHALMQCKKYLEKNFPNAKLIKSKTTSTAARDLSVDNLSPDCAVIASKNAAEIYRLDVIAANIEDSHQNVTHFKVLFNRK
jgi:chorismate mutase / prephenate dehydratase